MKIALFEYICFRNFHSIQAHKRQRIIISKMLQLFLSSIDRTVPYHTVRSFKHFIQVFDANGRRFDFFLLKKPMEISKVFAHNTLAKLYYRCAKLKTVQQQEQDTNAQHKI